MAPTFWVVRIGAALAALAIVALAAWWIIGRPITAATQAAQAKVDAKLGQATGQAAVDAIPAITEAQRQRVAIDVQVQKGVIDVRQAPGAGTDARAVSDATLRALCLLERAPDAESATGAVLVDPHCERFIGADAPRR